MSFPKATIVKKANIYFAGDVISRNITTAEGEHKTLGFMQKGSYHFTTEAAEIMEVLHGECRVKLEGTDDTHIFSTGESFDVPANSSFDIDVADMLDYVCHFKKA